MNKLILLLALLNVLPLARAQDEATTAVQRDRINAERARAEAAFSAEEKACYASFAVNDCLNAAKARRRTVLGDLQRQEISLNDAERKRKAIERVRAGEERAASDRRQGDAQRAKAAAQLRQREAAAGENASQRAAQAASSPARAAARRERIENKQAGQEAARLRRAADEAQNRERRERRLAEAEERRVDLEKKLASRKKPAARPLPVEP
jgi:colicin import membrane protein